MSGLWGSLLQTLEAARDYSAHSVEYIKGVNFAITQVEKVAKWEAFLGKTREQVKRELGEPVVGGITKKCRSGTIYRYGDIELNFQPWKLGKCVSVFDESKHQLICEARGCE